MDGFFLFIFIGVIAGWVAGVAVERGGFALLGDVSAGMFGALMGGNLFGAVGIGGSGMLGAVMVATVGAFFLIGVLRLLRRFLSPQAYLRSRAE